MANIPVLNSVDPFGVLAADNPGPAMFAAVTGANIVFSLSLFATYKGKHVNKGDRNDR